MIDLTSAQGKAQFEQLVSTADILLESFRPGTMTRLGLDYDTLHKLNRRLIYCSITGYGRTSASRDRPAYDALVQARLGMHFEQPSYRRNADGSYVDGPVFLYVPLPSYGAMLLASAGISAALHAREVTGEGQWVETTLAQGALMWTSQIRYRGSTSRPGSPPCPITGEAPFTSARTESGCMRWSSAIPTRRCTTCSRWLPKVVTFPASARPSRNGTGGESTSRRRSGVGPVTRSWLSCSPPGSPSCRSSPPRTSYTTPQLIHNGMVAEVDDPEEGRIKMVGIPYQMEKTTAFVKGPQPGLGQHTEEILGSLETLA